MMVRAFLLSGEIMFEITKLNDLRVKDDLTRRLIDQRITEITGLDTVIGFDTCFLVAETDKDLIEFELNGDDCSVEFIAYHPAYHCSEVYVADTVIFIPESLSFKGVSR
jgi:hypothetical protein